MKLKNTLLLFVMAVLLSGCFRILVYSMGDWKNFQRTGGFNVSINDHAIDIQAGTKQYHKEGRWANDTFYAKSGFFDSEVAVAHAPDDHSLEVQMKYFDPSDTSTVTCTKIRRGYSEAHPYPTRETRGLVVTYPPPKGLIRPGMLEADLQTLPWESPEIEVAGENSSDSVEIYSYRSDNPKLPVLKVTVVNGIVKEVIGGAENEPGPGWGETLASPVAASAAADGKDTSWVGWLFDLFFKK